MGICLLRLFWYMIRIDTFIDSRNVIEVEVGVQWAAPMALQCRRVLTYMYR